ncbi:MAG TPA: M12 family metallopeptidase, partial [Caldilineaceae bacterium]|nr:M12 family metallopeptidase [Caldilineaceae bacterium]
MQAVPTLNSVYLPVIVTGSNENSGDPPTPVSTSAPTPTVQPTTVPTSAPTPTVQPTPIITGGIAVEILLPGHQSKSLIRYQAHLGHAIFQGDIDLGPEAELNAAPLQGYIRSTYTAGVIQQPVTVIAGVDYRWPGGVIPFVIDSGVTTTLQSAIQVARNEWNTRTNLTMVERSTESDFVRFVQDDDLLGAGQSKVGRRGGQQDIKLIADARASTVIHEIGHAVGLWHEQSRMDRDSYIEILWDNIVDDAKHNFERHVEDGIDIGLYDFSSIIHYQSTAFGKIDPLSGKLLVTLRSRIPGQAISPGSQLSTLDRQGIDQLYPVNTCGRVPLLFEDSDQAGNSLSLEFSRPNLSDFDFNDKASSLCIPVGWTVSLFGDGDYNGHIVDLVGPQTIDNLGSPVDVGGTWNDRISSVRVSGVQANPTPSICTTMPVAFEHDYYGGRQLQLAAGMADFQDLSFGDIVSSVCVPAGWVLTFRTDAGYGGDYIDVVGPLAIGDLERDSPDDHNWGDVLSSVQVEGPAANQAPTQCADSPILFQHDHFRGEQFDLTHDMRDLHQVSFGDIASSLCVPAGWQIVVFEHADFGGDRLDLTGETIILDLKHDQPNGQDWGDKISSVRVIPPGGTPPITCSRPQLYEHDSFSGQQFEIARTLPTLHPFGAGDNASSVCVPVGWTVELFEHSDYGGQMLRLIGPATEADLQRNAPDGRDWGDIVSSVIVSAPPGTPPIVGCTSPSVY